MAPFPRGKTAPALAALFLLSLSASLHVTAHAQEADDDLAETPEVKFTAENAPGVQKLLDDEGLRGSPAKIVNWVRNHIEFVPIWGALQSSVTCLDNRKGTAMDIASLTIALLRGSGIRARYQAGTVRLPIEEAKNWLGNFESAIAASSLLQSGGIPAAVQVDSAGKPAALRFEHVWVRAYVDYIPYQGACHLEGDTWLDLDTSFKSYQHATAVQLTPFFPPGFPLSYVDEFLSKANIDPNTKEFSLEQEVSVPTEAPEAATEHLLAHAGSLTTLEILGDGRIRQSTSSALGVAPDFEILARGWERAELGPAEHFSVNLRLEMNGQPLFSFTVSAPKIGFSRFSIHFEPETDLDRRIIADQLPQEVGAAGPASFLVAGVRLVPYLRRDGQAVATGEAVDMGTALDLLVDYLEPALETPPIHMRMVAGEPVAIGLDLVKVPQGLLDRVSGDLAGLLRMLERGNASWDLSVFQELLLSSVIQMWFVQADAFNKMGTALGCVTHRYPSAGICSAKWHSETLFGLPLSGTRPGFTVDIPGDVVILLNRDGDTRRMRDATLIQGMVGSALEGLVPRQLFATSEERALWLSSSNALLANLNSGGALAVITGENLGAILPKLNMNAEERAEIQEAVDRGLSVFAHEDSLVDASEKCHSGYIIFDPSTGNGVYRIAGGLCGAEPFKCVLEENPDSPIQIFGETWLKGFVSKAKLTYPLWIAEAQEGHLSPRQTVDLIVQSMESFTANYLRTDKKFVELSVAARVDITQVALSLAKLEVLLDAFETLGEMNDWNLGLLTNFTMTGVLGEYEDYVRFNGALSADPVSIPEHCFERRPISFPGR